MQEAFIQAIELAQNRREIIEPLQAIYAQLQQEIDRRQPRCIMSGRCCRFDEFGHRLYITTIEMAVFLNQHPRRWEVTHPGVCPFQENNLCGVHAIRPFGCRIFFCDPSADQWQQQQYERFHQQLKGLHDVWSIPYFYVEWRTALGWLKT